MRLFALFSLVLVPQLANANIGSVTDVFGVAAVFREEQQSDAIVDFGIESYDDVRTAAGRIELKFLDDSVLKLTEHSEIIIDEFIYDPDPTKSKLALNFASGTARFITGALGTIDKDNIKITTPTAEIAIRGTDFTATVDELGRTLIILLPDEFGDASGEIVVASMMGQVTLNKPYQATTVSMFEKEPTSPKILDITLGLIDNMLIVSPPKESVEEDQVVEKRKSLLDFNDLEAELLEDELANSEENLEYSELDMDLLDVDFLRDLLDILEDIDREEEEEENVLEEQGTFSIQGTAVGLDSTTQISTFIEGQQVVMQRQVENYARLELLQGMGYNIMWDDNGEKFNIILNQGGDVYITIVQE
jgi:hypothetical protein